MPSILEAWTGTVWVGDLSWLTLASLRALVTCFTALVIIKGVRRPARQPSYILYMSGAAVIVVAFVFNFSVSVVADSRPMLTWNALFIDVGLILCMLGALFTDNRLRQMQGLEPKSNLGGLSTLQRRAALILGILTCVFTVSIDGIQLVFGALGVLLMLAYLLPTGDD